MMNTLIECAGILKHLKFFYYNFLLLNIIKQHSNLIDLLFNRIIYFVKFFFYVRNINQLVLNYPNSFYNPLL